MRGGKINANDSDIGASYSKGRIDSKWKSATGQAGIYAGADGFHIHVEKNTDLKGAVIASEASPDKNKLTTGTLTYGGIENSASYSAGSKGLSYRKFANGAYGAGEDHNMKGLTPVLSVPRERRCSGRNRISQYDVCAPFPPNQALSPLSRDTNNALNEPGKYIGLPHTCVLMCAAVFFIGGVVAFTMICRSSCEGMFVDSGGDRCGWFSPDGHGCRRCLSKKAGGSIIKVYYHRDGCILGGLLI